MLDHINHIGIAVEDMAAAVARYTALGLRVTHDESVPTQGTRAVFLSAAQGADIELLGALGADTPVGRFLAKRGPGLHHICYAVADLPAAIAHCQAQGLELVDPTPRRGAKGKALVFLHPKGMGGVMIELYAAD